MMGLKMKANQMKKKKTAKKMKKNYLRNALNGD